MAVWSLDLLGSEFFRMPEGFAVEPEGLAVGPLGHLESEFCVSESYTLRLCCIFLCLNFEILYFVCLLCFVSLFCVFQDFFHSFHLLSKDLSCHAPELELPPPQSCQGPELGFPLSCQAAELGWSQSCQAPVLYRPRPLPLPFPLPLPVPCSHASFSF